MELKNLAGASPPGADHVAGLGCAPGCAAATVALVLHEVRKVEPVVGCAGATRKVLVKGAGYDRPNEGATVRALRLEGKLEDGTVFMPAHDVPPFVAGEGELSPPALDKAVMAMAKGETALLSIPAGAPGVGFGPGGAPAGEGGRTAPIPAGYAGRALYTATLADFEKEKETWDLTTDGDKLSAAEERKRGGNELFAAGHPARAAKRYARALKARRVPSPAVLRRVGAPSHASRVAVCGARHQLQRRLQSRVQSAQGGAALQLGGVRAEAGGRQGGGKVGARCPRPRPHRGQGALPPRLRAHFAGRVPRRDDAGEWASIFIFFASLLLLFFPSLRSS